MKKKKPSYSDNLLDYYGSDVQEEMMLHMYNAAGRIMRPNEDLDYHKPADEPYYESQKRDSIYAYKRAGLTPKTGADNDEESLEYSRKMKVGVNKKSNAHAKRK